MRDPSRDSIRRWGVLLVLFFLSGISGLIYESIWSRYIRLFVGSAATAQVLVLSLFMGGMSVGALLAGRIVPRIRRPVLAYGMVEGIIGLYALAFPLLQSLAMRACYDFVFPALGEGVAVPLVKWTVASLLILPPCVLLGMTFPLMSVGILRRDPERSGEILSLLYFTNSFGASLGAMLSGFVLVGAVGLPGTLAVAATLNIAIFLAALRFRTPMPPIQASKPSEPGRQPLGPLVWLFLLVAFGTGLSSFMYEIGWIRLLSMILGSATHSFEVMLSSFVLGLALGGLWVRKRMDRFKRPELILGLVQLVMGLAAIATLPAYRIAVLAMGSLLAVEEHTAWMWVAFNVLRYALCLLIMLPATFCAGMTLPLLTHVMLRRGQSESAVGHVYGVNTLGAIVGAILAGLVLMPLIGLKQVVVGGAVVDMVLGLGLLRLESRRSDAMPGTTKLLRNATAAAGLTTLAGLFVVRMDPMVLTSTVFRNGRTRLPEEYDIISYVDGRTASVTVVDNTAHDGYNIIYTNGKPDASVILKRWPAGRDPSRGPEIAGDEPNQFLVGLLPLMARPDAATAALIGFGSGVTCHTILGSPKLERLDTVEIEPEMVAGARHFEGVNTRAYEDPRSHIWFDDAKAYFASSGEQYDFIISEPTNPWVSGVSSLFTVEFYREAKRYLKPGGLLGQWIQGYELSDDLLITVLAAIDREFEDYLVLRVGSRDWMLLSAPDGAVGRLSPEPLTWEGTKEAFDLLGIHDIGQVDGLIWANRKMLHPFLADKTPNTDALPLLDTGAERARFFGSSAEFLHKLRWTPAPLLMVLGGIERREYPRRGIGDLRDPHILTEMEQAVLLMRVHDNPDTKLPEGTSAYAMRQWRKATDKLRREGKGWDAWLRATYDVYKETASHFPIHSTSWWTEVKATAEDGPQATRDDIELLDALSAVDGARLRRVAESALSRDDSQLPWPLITIAQMLALELTSAPAAERHAHVERYMIQIGNGPDSEDCAYRALRAYADRP